MWWGGGDYDDVMGDGSGDGSVDVVMMMMMMMMMIKELQCGGVVMW